MPHLFRLAAYAAKRDGPPIYVVRGTARPPFRNLSSLYADINESWGKKAYEVVGIAAENSQPIENERERSVPRRCCSTSRCLPSLFSSFLSFFFPTRTLVAGEYYYSRQNSSSLVAGECEGRGAYIGRVKLEQRRNQIAG